MAESATRIETWQAVERHLAGAHGGRAAGDGGGIELVVPLAGSRPGAHGFWRRAGMEAAQARLAPQPVVVSPLDVEGAPWIAIVSVIGSARYVSRVEMLANNLHQSVGAFCLRDGWLAMRQTLPLLGLRVADLDEAIHAVAHQSGWARKHVAEGEATP